jgi:hypothetical protein
MHVIYLDNDFLIHKDSSKSVNPEFIYENLG